MKRNYYSLIEAARCLSINVNDLITLLHAKEWPAYTYLDAIRGLWCWVDHKGMVHAGLETPKPITGFLQLSPFAIEDLYLGVPPTSHKLFYVNCHRSPVLPRLDHSIPPGIDPFWNGESGIYVMAQGGFKADDIDNIFLADLPPIEEENSSDSGEKKAKKSDELLAEPSAKQRIYYLRTIGGLAALVCGTDVNEHYKAAGIIMKKLAEAKINVEVSEQSLATYILEGRQQISYKK